MKLRTILGLGLPHLLLVCALPLAAAPNSGKISGVVFDPNGTAQMGATVTINSDLVLGSSQLELFTNDRGRFSASGLRAGTYSIKVTLAGFLPAIERHIEVADQRTTVLEVVLGSVFASFDRLRQQPNNRAAKDDWAWVLRTSAATRSVLQWQDDPRVIVLGQEADEAPSPRTNTSQLLLSAGGDHPGSIGAESDSPATAFAYDIGVGEKAKFVMAGQISFEQGAGAESFAGEWIPSGKAGVGPLTTLVVRQSQLGPSGPMFRGLRMSHDDQIALSDRVGLRYGGQILVVGFMGKTTTTMRPRGELDIRLGQGWLLDSAVSTQPWGDNAGALSGMDSALQALDVFPTVMMRRGRPLTEDDLHEEIALAHALGNNARLSLAFFHDGSNHTAVMGRGGASNAPDFLQDYFSQAFAYDGGGSSSSGVRVAYDKKLSESLKTTLVYAYGGALAPVSNAASSSTLRSELSTESRQSLAARTSATVPVLKTKVVAGYKWIDGRAVSQLDAYGQAAYDIAPYLSLQIRQPLPNLFAAHMEIEADGGNLLAQGYVPMATNRGQVILVPSYRYFRGGLSFQF